MIKMNQVVASALLAAGIPLAAFAQTTQSVQVSVQVSGSCSLTAPLNANFGNILPGPTASNLTATGSVTLRCNRGASPVVAVNNGGNFSTTRRMSNGAPTPAFVSYAVKQPTITGSNFTVCPAFGGGTAWSTGGAALNASASFTSSGGTRPLSVCFEATIDENMAVATYTDTVALTVTF